MDCTHSAFGGEDTAGTGDSKQLPVNCDQLSGENTEAGQWADDFDPDHNPDPKLPPPYEPWWRPGMDVTVTMLEDEAYRLAIEGVTKPIFQRGIEVGERRVRSERLLKFLLISSAFKKYGRREVGPLQAEEEPGRPEFVAKLNAIYGQDEELHRKFTEVFERNNARRHAERIANLQRQNRGSKAPPSREDAETGRHEDTETGQGKSEQLSVKSNQSSVGNEWDVLDFDQFSAEVAALSSPAPSKAPPCTHGASGAEDTGQKGNLTLDHDLNHNLVLSGSAGVAQPGSAAKEPPAGTTENQGPTPEHDAAWYSPSARAARITQSMIEHRLRRRRVEM